MLTSISYEHHHYTTEDFKELQVEQISDAQQVENTEPCRWNMRSADVCQRIN